MEKKISNKNVNFVAQKSVTVFHFGLHTKLHFTLGALSFVSVDRELKEEGKNNRLTKFAFLLLVQQKRLK